MARLSLCRQIRRVLRLAGCVVPVTRRMADRTGQAEERRRQRSLYEFGADQVRRASAVERRAGVVIGAPGGNQCGVAQCAGDARQSEPQGIERRRQPVRGPHLRAPHQACGAGPRRSAAVRSGQRAASSTPPPAVEARPEPLGDDLDKRILRALCWGPTRQLVLVGEIGCCSLTVKRRTAILIERGLVKTGVRPGPVRKITDRGREAWLRRAEGLAAHRSRSRFARQGRDLPVIARRSEQCGTWSSSAARRRPARLSRAGDRAADRRRFRMPSA